MASHPAPAGDLLHLDRLRAGARGLPGDALPPHTLAMAQGTHDGPDHGDQQHKAGGLEQVDIVGVDEAAERAGVVHVAELGRARLYSSHSCAPWMSSSGWQKKATRRGSVC